MSLQKLRIIFGLTAAGFLMLCNLAYLLSYYQNRWHEFATQIDQPPIKIFSLLILIGIIGFSLVRPDIEDGEQC
jgi:hypothetical protein